MSAMPLPRDDNDVLRQMRRPRLWLAAGLARFAPEAFYLLADRRARDGMTVRRSGASIDIIDRAQRRLLRIGRAHAVYIPLMCESFDYFFCSAPYRGDPFALVDFSTPRFHRIRGFDDFPILCPSLTEPFVTATQYLDFADLRPGHVVLDLGAYSGLTAIAFSKEVGAAGRIVALEPDPINFAIAQTNLATHRRVNGLDNVELLPLAVAPAAGPVGFCSEGTMGSSLVSLIGSYRGRAMDVRGTTLMDLAEQYATDRVDFVKMDIEGSEAGVLPASRDFLLRYRPKLIIEPHLVHGRDTAGPIAAFLTALGYRCAVIEQTGLLTLPLLTAVWER